eukprot:Em0002g1176a
MNPAVTTEMSKKRAVDSESPLENESAKKRMVTMVWWKDKQCRQPTHDTRAPPTFKTTSAVTVSEPEPAYTFSLEDWDTFIEDYVNNA